VLDEHGKPVVEGLLADSAWRPVAHFTLRVRELVLLENTARPALEARAATKALGVPSVPRSSR
jgi:hypothetical protein